MMRTLPTLIHIRHGQTDWNVESRLQGQQDIPLNPHGRAQAARNGRVLAVHLEAAGLDPDTLDWIASPLGRARETMEIVRDAAGLPPTAYRLEPQLKEVTFGTWEGFTIPELKLRDPAGVGARRADKWGFVPPGGESYAMLSARIAAWLAQVERPAVIVSHGGVQRVLEGLLLGRPNAEIPNLDVPQDRFVIYRAGASEWL